jgi:hypothetical protein
VLNWINAMQLAPWSQRIHGGRKSAFPGKAMDKQPHKSLLRFYIAEAPTRENESELPKTPGTRIGEELKARK